MSSMKTRIIILSALVFVLCLMCGMYYVNIQNTKEMLEHDRMAKEREEDRKHQIRMEELRLQEQRLISARNGVTNDSNQSANTVSEQDNTQRTVSTNEKLRQENEELRNKLALSQGEREMLMDRESKKITPEMEEMNIVSKAQMIGKVLDYLKGQNLVLFTPLTEMNLTIGSRVAIRKNSAILAYGKIDGIDTQSGTYSIELERDKQLENATEISVENGDDIIIPPAELQSHRPKLPAIPAPPRSSDVIPIQHEF